MKTIKDLTPAIKAKIPMYKSIVRDNLYSGKEHQTNKREDTVKYIEKIYEIAKQPKPVVLIAKNPLQYQQYFRLLHTKKVLNKIKLIHYNKNKSITENISNELDSELYNELNRELYNELGNELRNELGNELNNELYNELYNELNNELRNELYNELRNELRNELNNELDSELRNELGNELGNLQVKSHWLSFCSCYSRVMLTWYYFIHKELNVSTSKSKELCELYELINKTFIARCYFTKGYVLVLKTPSKILRNEIGFNSIDSPAIQFEGNYGMYYINGRKLNKQTFDKVLGKEYTFEEFAKEDNEDVKSAILSLMEQKFGEQYAIDFIGSILNEVDTYIHKKEDKYLEGTTQGMNIGVYTLMKGDLDNNTIAYVRCFCPSTDRMFYLGVQESHTNAKDAIASLYRVPKKLVNHIVRILRQGERYSTVFDEEGTKMLKEQSVDFGNCVPISGDKYFKLITYEY